MAKRWSGKLESDATWAGDIRVDGDVLVPEGVSLRILPGSRVSFSPNPLWSCAVFRPAAEGYPIEATCREACDLVVRGRLEVLGSEEQPVLLGADETAWGGVSCLGLGAATLRWARARRCRETILQTFDDARLALSDCRLSGAEVGIWSWGLSRVRVDRTLIRVSRAGILASDGSLVSLQRVRWEDTPQGCSTHDWSLLTLEDGRISGHREHFVTTWQNSWARLVRCRRTETHAKIFERDLSRLQVSHG